MFSLFLPVKAQLEEPCQQASLTSIDLLVAGTDCDLDSLLETVGQLREIHPGLKVVIYIKLTLHQIK